MNRKALIYIELKQNKVLDVTKEIISKANTAFVDTELCGVVLSDKTSCRDSLDELRALNLSKIYILEDDIFDNVNTCIYSKILVDFILNEKFDIFLMGATSFGRDLAPRTASQLNIGLTADCTEITLDDSGNLLATRPTYGGQLMATIISNTKPGFATIRPGAFKIQSYNKLNSPSIINVPINSSGFNLLLEVLNCEPKEQLENWTCSDVIVAGGLGLKTKENFNLVYKFADLVGAKPAASRCAVEQGWAPSTLQVGQTGVSVSPKLYLAFGISGAMQHMVGITNSDKIIAVNIDENAPIMKASDYAIKADAIGVLKALIAILEK